MAENPNPPNPSNPPAPPAPSPQDEKDKEIARLKAELDAAKKPAPTPDPDLADKARKEREAREAGAAKTKSLEDALKFNLTAQDFLKENERYLPKEIAEIFSQAEKEQYGDAVQKVTAVKEGTVRQFFSLQANRDFLTKGLQTQLDDWLKLTKDGRLEKANQVYETLLEPTLDRMKAEAKAKALHKGYGVSGGDDAYADKLKNRAFKNYGVKDGS